ncbi:MAG TPA: TIGR03087 family PEP-CTERM/XrtA system glycosyltransferase [Acetobacteraceae bacterium]|jgi:sugar transferase (PEP-CTERM/EpsH1 system associated)|nr:TIGR03087 family PEP-CTERM/XrtA system glycosyltransferase [Acetobacteraceae bacterium]
MPTDGSLLFLCHRIPYPPIKGDKIRAWHFLEHLASRFDVHLGCFIDDPADWAHVPVLEKLCARVLCVPLDKRRQKLRSLLRLRPGRPLTLDYFGNRRLSDWAEETLAQQNVTRIFVFCSAMAEYVMHADTARRVLDMVDIDSEKFAEYAKRTSWPMRGLWAREGRTLLAFERRAAAAFDRTLLVTAAEAARFACLSPETRNRVGFIENGVDLQHFSPEHAFPCPFSDRGPHLVFTGTMDYWPNSDAVGWFAREVLPLVRTASPDVRFTIVGANPTPEVLALKGEAVTVTGSVDDVRPYLAHCAASVAPLRIARGVQNKVLEAMAMGRIVVASADAFEGVRANPGRDLLVVDSARAMADAILDVLAGRHSGMGAAARRAMEIGYDWRRSLDALDEAIGATSACLTGPQEALA